MEKATAAGGLEKFGFTKEQKVFQNDAEGQLLLGAGLLPCKPQWSVVAIPDPKQAAIRPRRPGKKSKNAHRRHVHTGMCQIFSAMNGRSRPGVGFLRPAAASRPHWLRFDALRVEKQEKASGAGGRPHNTCQVSARWRAARTQSDKTRCRRGFGSTLLIPRRAKAGEGRSHTER